MARGGGSPRDYRLMPKVPSIQRARVGFNARAVQAILDSFPAGLRGGVFDRYVAGQRQGSSPDVIVSICRILNVSQEGPAASPTNLRVSRARTGASAQTAVRDSSSDLHFPTRWTAKHRCS